MNKRLQDDADPLLSPWGERPWQATTPRPSSLRPGEQVLPVSPRAASEVRSYHAHVYFDEDSHYKAAQLRRWIAERFVVELGPWNTGPVGPHTSPSFYFGFTRVQLLEIFPWLQLNSLGLTILIHPNTGDPRADHLYYAAWINRTQAVNAYGWSPQRLRAEEVESIRPNTRPGLR